MNAAQLRQTFLTFFERLDHALIGNAPLLSENDPSVLFTTAGMHPLTPFLLGEPHPAGKRLANVQKCLRTDDITEVGDDVHRTFFEMLGNWSLGDYGKETAIRLASSFLTGELGLAHERLAVTCFAGDADAPRDEEAAAIWMSLDVPHERIRVFLHNAQPDPIQRDRRMPPNAQCFRMGLAVLACAQCPLLGHDSLEPGGCMGPYSGRSLKKK